MEPIRAGLEFLTSAENWAGTFGIPGRIWEHVLLSGLAVAAAAILALPVGLLIGHTRRGEFIAVSIGNIGRALPSFGILAIVFVPSLRYDFPGDIGFSATLIAMILLAIPPILINTYVGIQGVDPDTLEAARAMGMNWRQILFILEVPLAVPLIIAGIRTAAVAVVATATLGALAGWGGLGRFIIDGFATGDDGQILAGAFLVALLAVLTELGFGLAEKALSPKGLGPHVYVPGEPQLAEPSVGATAA